MSNNMSDMKSASIRTMQHQLAALVAEVERGGEIVITRRSRPVARLLPAGGGAEPAGLPPAAVRGYWKKRRKPPSIRSRLTHADLIAQGRDRV